MLLLHPGIACLYLLHGVILTALRFGQQLFTLLPGLGDDLLRPGLGVHDHLLGDGFGGKQRVADLIFLAVQQRQLTVEQSVFLTEGQRLLPDILQHGLHLVGIIVFFLDNVDVYRVEILLVQCHNGPPVWGKNVCSGELYQKGKNLSTGENFPDAEASPFSCFVRPFVIS